MNASNRGLDSVFSIITIVLGVLVAFFILFIGVVNLIHPDVPDNYLAQNTRVCIIFILTGLVTIYSFFRPASGGVILCICAGVIYIVINRNPVAYPILFLGLLSIIRALVKRRKVTDGPIQTA